MKNVLFFILCMSFTAVAMGQDSLNMKRVGILSGLGAEYNDVWGYQHGSREFAVVGSNTAINIVDVTDCSNPTLVHQWVDGTNTFWRDFKEYEDYVYAVCDVTSSCNQGLQIINKNNFTQTQNQSDFTKAHNIFVDKSSGRLYVLGSNTSNNGVFVYDVKTDPSNPVLLKNVKFRELPGEVANGNYYIHDAYVQNDTMYASHGYPGMKIWDMRDLENVYRIGAGDSSGGYNHSAWKHSSEPYLYIAEEVPIGRPIYVYDISDIEEPFTTNSFKDPLEAPASLNNRPHNPFVKLDRLYISYYHDGLQVYDLEDPEAPNRIAYYDTYPDNNGNGYSGYEGAWGAYPFLPSGCLLASDITYGLNTLKMTITPEARNRITNSDIVIEDPTKGIVFITPDDQYARISLGGGSDIQVDIIGDAPSERVEIINSNVQFEDSNFGIVLKSAGGKYFRVGIDNTGQLTTSITALNPDTNITLMNEDLYFSQYRGGPIFKNGNGDCNILTLGDNGAIEISSIDCE